MSTGNTQAPMGDECTCPQCQGQRGAARPVATRPQAYISLFTPDERRKTMEELEREAIVAAIRDCPSISEAAIQLGIGRSTIYRKLREHGLTHLYVGGGKAA